MRRRNQRQHRHHRRLERNSAGCTTPRCFASRARVHATIDAKQVQEDVSGAPPWVARNDGARWLMSGREQEPWQRNVRRTAERGSWEIQPGVDTPRQYQPPEHTPPPLPPIHDHTGMRFPVADSTWKASASFGRLIGIAVIIGSLALTGAAIWRVFATDGTARLLAVVAALMMAIATAYLWSLYRGLDSIRYTIGADRLTIAWMNERHTIPLADIQDVVYEPRSSISARGYERLWPGYSVSTRQMRDGVWHSVATQSPARRVRIVTRRGIYAISPERPILFLGELARRRRGADAGPTSSTPAPRPRSQADVSLSRQPPYQSEPQFGIDAQRQRGEAFERRGDTGPLPQIPDTTVPTAAQGRSDMDQRHRHPPSRARDASQQGWLFVYRHLFRERLLGDPIASGLIAVGVMLPLVMVAVLYSQYEGVSAVIPLHWNAHAEVDQYGTRRDLWRFPLMAAVVLVFNATFATLALTVDRFMARLIVAATPVVQLLIFVALVRAVS